MLTCKLNHGNRRKNHCRVTKSVLVFLFFLVPAIVNAEPVRSIKVDGDVNNPGVWTNHDLRDGKLCHTQLIRYKQGNSWHSSNCVPLFSLIAAASPKPLNDANVGKPNLPAAFRNVPEQVAALVSGYDGYRAQFALSELEQRSGSKTVWVALDEDDKPLVTKKSPAFLIVPSDSGYRRWVHGIVEIEVLQFYVINGTPKQSLT